MFRSTPETFPTHFIEGDVFNPKFLEVVPPFAKNCLPTAAFPTLSGVKTLNDLQGHVSALFVGAFFHLFTEQEQERIARALAGLLSPEPGSMILGAHGGAPKKGIWNPARSDYQMFRHSPESWKDLWEGIFGKGNVEVQARITREEGGNDFFGTWPGNDDPYYVLEWSVTRL